jgi:RNA polymerase sigma-70 factor (ECF subfamily)
MDAEDADVELVGKALAGDELALERLVAQLAPVVQARVARTLLARRWGPTGGRSLRQDVEDLSQDVFLSLFAADARVLRRWEPERGLSLGGYVGLVSERLVVSFLRSGKRNPWKEEPATDAELDVGAAEADPEEVAASREQLRLLLRRLRESVSPLGRKVFELLFVQDLSLEQAMAASGLSADAVYAWRSRLRRLARELLIDLSETAVPPRKSRERGKG